VLRLPLLKTSCHLRSEGRDEGAQVMDLPTHRSHPCYRGIVQGERCPVEQSPATPDPARFNAGGRTASGAHRWIAAGGYGGPLDCVADEIVSVSFSVRRATTVAWCEVRPVRAKRREATREHPLSTRRILVAHPCRSHRVRSCKASLPLSTSATAANAAATERMGAARPTQERAIRPL